MLGWILLGLATAAVGVIVISGMVTKSRIKEKMREKGLHETIITEINYCTNTVKLEDLYSDDTLEIQGDELDYELEEYDTITA
jgi:ABC-type bacteriocin/lantibiotic exporter with double-glycine peptidase domain